MGMIQTFSLNHIFTGLPHEHTHRLREEKWHAVSCSERIPFDLHIFTHTLKPACKSPLFTSAKSGTANEVFVSYPHELHWLAMMLTARTEVR